MLFPRLLAVAELAWSAPQAKVWENFKWKPGSKVLIFFFFRVRLPRFKTRGVLKSLKMLAEARSGFHVPRKLAPSLLWLSQDANLSRWGKSCGVVAGDDFMRAACG